VDKREAQAAFESGQLKEAVIEPAEAGNGWMVLLRDSQGKMEKLTDHSGIEKVYHELDHATEAAQAIGFTDFRVEEAF
jgi:hypothetical protein